jgi:hypothetical protein
MKRFRGLALLMLALSLPACDPGLRKWAREEEHPWHTQTVHRALRAYCELEWHVYEDYHKGVLTPVLRFCPNGPTDPVQPPPPPPGWDD